MFQSSSEPFGLILGAGVMFVVGGLDDLIDVSPPAKVAGQVVAASLLAFYGVVMFYFRMPFNLFHTDTVVLGSQFAPLVTALWVVLMTNAVNLIDGLDGLAVGIVAIARRRAVPVRRPAVQAELHRRHEHRPARRDHRGRRVPRLPAVQLASVEDHDGRRGCAFLGVLLAVPTITIGGRTDHAFSGNTFFFFGPLLIPVLILGVPILDTVFSFLRRMVKRQRWHQADAGHLHHRLMRLGHGPRRTVVILWAWTALLSGVALGADLLPQEREQRARAVRRRPRWRSCCSPGSTPESGRGGNARRAASRHPRPRLIPGEEVVDLAERRRRRA